LAAAFCAAKAKVLLAERDLPPPALPCTRLSQYPGWLANKRGAIPEEEHVRYTRQSALVAQLLAVFDNAPDDSSRVMQLMQEMQACGAPPQEIMSELAPGIEFGSDGAPRFPAVAPDGSGGVPPELAASCAQM
jgi:hypothetical protein